MVTLQGQTRESCTTFSTRSINVILPPYFNPLSSLCLLRCWKQQLERGRALGQGLPQTERDWLKQRSSVPPGSSVHVYYNRIRNYSTSYEVQPKLGRVQLCDSFSSNHWKFTGSYGQSIRQCICRAKASTRACSVQT